MSIQTINNAGILKGVEKNERKEQKTVILKFLQ